MRVDKHVDTVTPAAGTWYTVGYATIGYRYTINKGATGTSYGTLYQPGYRVDL